MPLLDELLPDLAPDLRVPFPRVMADYARPPNAAITHCWMGRSKPWGIISLLRDAISFPTHLTISLPMLR